MDMKETYLKLKFIGFASLLAMILYTMHPYINGLGCDFRSQASHDNNSIYMSCKNGVMNLVATNNLTKESTHYKVIYGKSGDTIFGLVYSTKVLDDGDSKIKHITSALNHSLFYSAKVVPGSYFDWILMQSPYHNIFMTKRIGDMGFIE